MARYYNSPEKVYYGRGISLDSTPIAFGMDVFFYGFPLGNLGTEALGIKFPLVKKAIVSGWVKYNGADVMVLDGHVNPGFSGGPVVSYDSTSERMNVVGINTGYVPEAVDLQYKGDVLSLKNNSGIIVCYGRRYIEDIFTRHKKALL